MTAKSIRTFTNLHRSYVTTGERIFNEVCGLQWKYNNPIQTKPIQYIFISHERLLKLQYLYLNFNL